MSKVKTYLTLIFDENEPNWRENALQMEEEHAVSIIADTGISPLPSRRERHLFFPLTQSLTAWQLKILEQYKASGLFSNFYIKDEITPDGKEIEKKGHSNA